EHVISSIFYRRFKHLLSDNLQVVDCNHNRFQLTIIQGYTTAYILHRLQNLVSVYKLPKGGILKLRYLYDDIFYILKNKSCHNHPKSPARILYEQPVNRNNNPIQSNHAYQLSADQPPLSSPLPFDLNVLPPMEDEPDSLCVSQIEMHDLNKCKTIVDTMGTYPNILVLPTKFQDFFTIPPNYTYVEIPSHPPTHDHFNPPTLINLFPPKELLICQATSYTCYIRIEDTASLAL
ncbi:hypothetical protein S245_038157, partial [Arachis hypogaea]